MSKIGTKLIKAAKEARAIARGEMTTKADRKPTPYGKYLWIVRDPDFLGGKLAIRGTRLSASFVLACLADGMSAKEIAQTYGPFPRAAIPEIMKVASELLDSKHVTA
jgi:uncharacterized protein (DUF433 family)